MMTTIRPGGQQLPLAGCHGVARRGDAVGHAQWPPEAEHRTIPKRPSTSPAAGGVTENQRRWRSSPALGDDPPVQLDRQCVNLTCQVSVGLQLKLGLDEVVVRLCLLEGGLTVLPDQDERRQKDRL